MKGQSNMGVSIIVTAAILIVGVFVFFQIADAVPHRESFVNETLITGAPTNGSTYSLAHSPVRLPASTYLTLYRGNDTVAMTDGSDYVVNDQEASITIWNATAMTGVANITVDYTIDPLSQSQTQAPAQDAYTTVNSTTYSGFELAAVVIIVLAAVAVLGGLFVLGRA